MAFGRVHGEGRGVQGGAGAGWLGRMADVQGAARPAAGFGRGAGLRREARSAACEVGKVERQGGERVGERRGIGELVAAAWR